MSPERGMSRSKLAFERTPVSVAPSLQVSAASLNLSR
jgi:hypothetical protein